MREARLRRDDSLRFTRRPTSKSPSDDQPSPRRHPPPLQQVIEQLGASEQGRGAMVTAGVVDLCLSLIDGYRSGELRDETVLAPPSPLRQTPHHRAAARSTTVTIASCCRAATTVRASSRRGEATGSARQNGRGSLTRGRRRLLLATLGLGRCSPARSARSSARATTRAARRRCGATAARPSSR